MPKIAIIGAGVTGVTTAYALLERGYDVTVLDRHRYAAMEASYANGGQLSASNAEVWNSWPTVWKGLKWLFRTDAPLSLNLTPSWHKYSWLFEFIASIPKHRENTVATVKLAIAAREPLLAMADKAGIKFDVEHRGILHVYHNADQLAQASKANTILKAAGLDRREVSASEIRDIEPALKGQFAGGFFTASDFTGDIHKFTRGLMDYCVRRGVIFISEAEVTSIDTSSKGITLKWSRNSGQKATLPSESIYADGVVICAGVESRKFAGMLGDRVNIYPVKGYSITVELDDEAEGEAPWVSLLDEQAKVVTSRLGKNRLRVAGTAELNGINYDIRADRIRPLTDWVRQMFPAMSTDRIVAWAGLRPMMPDMMPRVGPGRRSGIFYNTGHGHLGWTLSAATAHIIAASVEQNIPK